MASSPKKQARRQSYLVMLLTLALMTEWEQKCPISAGKTAKQF